MNEKLLEEIGLTKGEIRVYLTLLKIGETTTGKIIDEAQISSGKIYEILDKLIKKGLVSYVVKEKTKYFSASSPRRILDYLYEKEKEIKEREEQVKKELPLLLELEKLTKGEYEIRLFQGFKGVQTAISEAYNEISQKDTILAIGIFSRRSQKFNVFWPKWHKERIRKKVKCKLIFSERNTDYYKKFKSMKYTEIKVIEGFTPAVVDVIGNRVLILTHGEEPYCLSIKHPEIVQSFKTFFESLWKIAKP